MAPLIILSSILAALVAASDPAADPAIPRVAARVETEPVTTRRGDRADDAAIWRNPADPAKSLIISTDKKAGLAIHDLSGRLLAFEPLGDINNVDLRDDVPIGDTRATLVAASDRSDKKRPRLHLFRLDPTRPALVPLGIVGPPEGQAYGLCLHRRGDRIDVFMIYKEGVVEQIELDLAARPARARILRRFDLGSRSEGCVADDRTGQLYVAEDKVALWRIATAPDRPMAPVKIAEVDEAHLFKDVEGLALLPCGKDGGLLFAANQGDDSYTLFRLPQGAFVGRFRIGGGAIDATEESDGIALDGRDFGPAWPGGLFVAHDGKNRDARGKKAPQNFKLVPLGAILAAFGEAGR